MAALSEVVRSSKASPVARLVLYAVAGFANEDGVSHPDRSSIALHAGCSRAQVAAALVELDALGELEICQAGDSDVFAICVGAFLGKPIDYARLPFELDEPFIQRAAA